ncbi:MAG: arginine--tRNA ligase [Pseudobdellovibrionaceae bacterium]
MIGNLKLNILGKIKNHSLVQRFGEAKILDLLERPKNTDHGHLALPCFALAKEMKTNPMELAKTIAQDFSAFSDLIVKAEPMGGFVNLSFLPSVLWSEGLKIHQTNIDSLGSVSAKNEIVAIDYASPNVAKPMHVGHFRAAVIGQSIRNLAESQGYQVLGINHLGDWGTQFGKLIWAIQEWEPNIKWEDPDIIDGLLQLYVRFHMEAEADSSLEAKGSETFKKLENGDTRVVQLWKQVCRASVQGYEKLFSKLGLKHDHILGESFYSDKLDDVVDRLKTKKILSDSEGAKVVFFPEELKMPPCLILKSDGASIYATRDLASAFYKIEQLKANHLLYVVGQDQSLHFKQVFKVIEMLGYPWAKNCHHIPFGMYRFESGKMSTRKGQIIEFEDLINDAIVKVGQVVAEKNPDLPNKEKTIEQIAVAALIFHDLLNDRVKDVEFKWEKMLTFDGDSGPYVQYTGVRCKSILKKYGQPVMPLDHIPRDFHQRELHLIYRLLLLEEVLRVSYQQFKPNILAQYLLDVCADFSSFYRECRVLGEAPEIETQRLMIVEMTRKVIVRGLGVLSIQTPESM